MKRILFTAVTLLLTSVGAWSQDPVPPETLYTSPEGITLDDQNLYFTDPPQNVIKKRDLNTGAEVVIAGNVGQSGSTDGKGAEALFSSPTGLTIQKSIIYVVDTGNQTIRAVDIKSGKVITIAGKPGQFGDTDGPGGTARFANPDSVIFINDSLYVSDTYNHTIRRISLPDLKVSTIAGKAGESGLKDGKGSEARMAYPKGLSWDGKNLFVADSENNGIRKIDLKDFSVTTVKSKLNLGLKYPEGLATAGDKIYIADKGNGRILELDQVTGQHRAIINQGESPNFEGPSRLLVKGKELLYSDTSKHKILSIKP